MAEWVRIEAYRRRIITNETQTKKIVIIAGPNGAGKTTFATEFLPHEGGHPVFINADLIASQRTPLLLEEGTN